MSRFAALLCLLAPLAAGAEGLDVTSKLQPLGNPTKARWPSGKAVYARNPWSLAWFDGRLYVGSGNSNNKGPAANSGPVDLWTYSFGKWTNEYEVADEQVDLFRRLGDELWIPGHDSHLTGKNPSWLKKMSPVNIVKDWAAGSVYFRKAGAAQWTRRRTIPNGIHVYDLAQHGKRLYAAISSVKGGEVAISDDQGRNWKKLPTSVMPYKRTRTLFALGGSLYASANDRKMYRLDEKRNGFVHLVADFFPGKSGELFAARPTVFKDAAVYIGGRKQIDHDWDSVGLFAASGAGDSLSARAVPVAGEPRDLLVDGGTLYVLLSREPAKNKAVNTVLATDDLKSFREVLRFEAGTFARSFALNDGNFFFGLGSDPHDLKPQTGEIVMVSKAAWAVR